MAKIWKPNKDINYPSTIKQPIRFHIYSLPENIDELNKIWDVIWVNPKHKFMVIIDNIDFVNEFIAKNAFAKHFDWIPSGRVPFKPRDLIHLDDLWMRNMCGCANSSKCACGCNNGYICDHAADQHSEQCKHGNRLCFSYQCPIGSDNPSKEVLEANDLGGQYEYDSEGYSIECDWIELNTRPRYAFVENVQVIKTSNKKKKGSDSQ